MAQKFLINGTVWDPAAEGFQSALELAATEAVRPLCMCIDGGVPMYLARHRGWIVKRMPLTGHRHHPGCSSFELAPGSSGLDAHWGKAVRETDTGLSLKVSFGLRAREAASLRGQVVHEPQVPASGVRGLSLAGLMHLLFDQSRLNRWSPAVMARYGQGVLYTHIMAAAQRCWAGGRNLSDQLLLVPEPFSKETCREAAQRRAEKLRALGQGRALVLGEFKAAESGGVGERMRVWLRHWPDWPLWVSASMWKRLERSQAQLMEAHATSQSLRLVMLAVLQPLREMTYQIHAVSLMLTTAQWIPLHAAFEEQLVQRLVEERRQFIKPLRYDSPGENFANVLLTDAGVEAVPLHLVSPFMKERERLRKLRVTEKSNDWVWDTTQPCPELPRRNT